MSEVTVNDSAMSRSRVETTDTLVHRYPMKLAEAAQPSSTDFLYIG